MATTAPVTSDSVTLGYLYTQPEGSRDGSCRAWLHQTAALGRVIGVADQNQPGLKSGLGLFRNSRIDIRFGHSFGAGERGGEKPDGSERWREPKDTTPRHEASPPLPASGSCRAPCSPAQEAIKVSLTILALKNERFSLPKSF